VSTAIFPLADCTSLKQSLATLRAEHETYAQFVTDLLGDLETMQQKLVEAEARIETQSEQLALHEAAQAEAAETDDSPSDDGQPSEAEMALQNKVAELEGDRQALEDELETIRTRAVEMAEVIAEQKRQMAEDQSQWMAELRQLRRLLDKQEKLISQQAELASLSSAAGDADLPGFSGSNGRPEIAPGAINGSAVHASSSKAAAGSESTQPQTAARARIGHPDPVLGSVMSQFELLQKDVARRRKQGANQRATKPSTPQDNANSS
jgi:myosin heavy subunit